MNIVLIIFFLSLIIIVHELGHFWAARRAGVRVINFFIGFGPPVLQRKFNKTNFCLNLLPLGGAVVLAGLDEGSKIKTSPAERYDQKSWRQKFGIISAGSFMNIFLGLIIFVFVYSVVGIPQNISATINAVLPGSPAAKAKLLAADTILKINSIPLKSGEELIKLIQHNPYNQPVNLLIQRNGKAKLITVVPIYNKETRTSALGIVLKPENYKKISIWQSLHYGFLETLAFIVTFFSSILKIFSSNGLSNIAGPVGIFDLSNQIWQYGMPAFLRFVGILSLNIGLLNLLPLPALDGGRLVFLVLEKLIGRPLNKNFEKYVHLIGFMILLSFIFWVSYNDIHRLLK